MKRIMIIFGMVLLVGLALVGVFGIFGSLRVNSFSAVNASLPPMNKSGIGGGAPAEMPVAIDQAAVGYDATGQRSLEAATGNSAGGQDRLVIQNAELTIVVKDPAAKMQTIAALANTMGGFVVSSNLYENYAVDGTKVPAGAIVVRIPAGKLDEALTQIKTDAIEVQSESRSGQDVTKEYTDVQSQLKNLEATEAQLSKIMEQADKTEDVLAVFNQLTQIRSQIEVLKGQAQYYEQSAALSAVTVNLVAEQTIKPIQIAGWEPQGVARDAAQALVDFFQGFVNFLIWLVIYFIPVAAVFIILVALLWRLGRWLWPKVFPKKSTPAE